MTPKRGPKVKWAWQVDEEDPAVVNLVDGQGALDEEVFIRFLQLSNLEAIFFLNYYVMHLVTEF